MPGEAHDLVDQEELHGRTQRGGDPGKQPGRESAPEGEGEQRKDRVESDVPGQGHRRAGRCESVLEPDVFEQRDAAQRHEGQQPVFQHPSQAENQRGQQQGESENLRRVGQRHPQDDHDEQQEGQDGRKGREVSGAGGVPKPGRRPGINAVGHRQLS